MVNFRKKKKLIKSWKEKEKKLGKGKE